MRWPGPASVYSFLQHVDCITLVIAGTALAQVAVQYIWLWHGMLWVLVPHLACVGGSPLLGRTPAAYVVCPTRLPGSPGGAQTFSQRAEQC